MNQEIDIVETFDWQPVWRVVTDASVFDRVVNDDWAKLPLEKLQETIKSIVDNPDNYVLLAQTGANVVGCFICYAMGKGEFEIHTMLTKACRGRDAVRAGKLAMAFLFQHFDVEVLKSFCPTNIPEAYLFSKLCGWKDAGASAGKWIKNGVEYAMKAVQITKEEYTMKFNLGGSPCR